MLPCGAAAMTQCGVVESLESPSNTPSNEMPWPVEAREGRRCRANGRCTERAANHEPASVELHKCLDVDHTIIRTTTECQRQLKMPIRDGNDASLNLCL